MKKVFAKTIFTILISISIFFNSVYAYDKSNVYITINKLLQPIQTDVINKNGSTLVAFRDLFTMIGAEVDWNSVKKLITAKKDDKKLEIYIDKNEAILDGKNIEMPVGVELINGVSYIPLRFACEAFGYKVYWDQVKKTIEITNDYGNYILLDELTDMPTENENKISLEQALELAKNNNSNLKNLEDTYKYLENSRDTLSNKLNDLDKNEVVSNAFPSDGSEGFINNSNAAEYRYLDTLINLAKSIKINQESSRLMPINEKIASDAIEQNLITSVIGIKKTKLAIDINKQNLKLNELNTKNLELKNKYGFSSEKELKDAKAQKNAIESNIKSLELDLETRKFALKDILGSKKDVDIDILLNIDFKDIDKIKLQQVINTSLENDLSIQILKSDIEVAKYNKTTSLVYTEEERIKYENDLKIAERKLVDAREELEKKIRSAYNNLLDMVNLNQTLKTDLDKSILDYNIVVANFIAGKATMLNVEQAKMKILESEKAIEENKLNFYTLFESFTKPYLL